MHRSTWVLVTGEIGLVAIGVAGLVYGEPALAYTAAGAFAGLVAGHLNGQQAAPQA